MLSPSTWKTPTMDVFRVNIYLKTSCHSICKDCTEAASASSLQLSHPKVPHLAACPTAYPWVPPPRSFCGSLLPCYHSRPCPPGPRVAAQLMALVMLPCHWCPSVPQRAPAPPRALPASLGPPGRTQEPLLFSVVATKSFTELLCSTAWLPNAPREGSLCPQCLTKFCLPLPTVPSPQHGDRLCLSRCQLLPVKKALRAAPREVNTTLRL